MTRSLLLLSAVIALVFASCGRKPGGVIGEEITYSSGGVPLKGYVAYKSGVEGRRPGVLVVHEWWGLNDYARRRARMLADLGYVALAVDMYGNGKTATHPDNAGKFAAEVMQHMDTAKARFLAAYELLKRQPECDSTRIGAIGYCFGGGVVLNMIWLGVPLDGVVSFHGALPTQPPPGAEKVTAKVLVCNGAEDPFNPPATVEQFNKIMDSAGVDYKFINYPGAKHSFTNPEADSLGRVFNLPLAYNAAADTESWAAMREFFKTVFKE
jgi:dienelactone hydrolase